VGLLLRFFMSVSTGLLVVALSVEMVARKKWTWASRHIGKVQHRSDQIIKSHIFKLQAKDSGILYLIA